MIKYLYLTNFIFFLSLCGFFLIRRHIITILISIELLLLSINLNFFIFSIFLDDLLGQLFSLFILIISATESAIGLSILLVYYRLKGTIFLNYINLLKG